MRWLSFEHGRAAYRADFLIYGAAVALLAALLIGAGPRGQGLALAALVLAGLLAWSLVEYALHRFVLHGLPLLRRWHEQHHLRPRALICTPTLLSGSLIALLVFLPAALLGDRWLASALTLGLLIGYLGYAVTHHAIHHGRGQGAWLLRRKRWHALHHRREGGSRCFGVTSAFWDRLFGSSPRSHGSPHRTAGTAANPAMHTPHRTPARHRKPAMDTPHDLRLLPVFGPAERPSCGALAAVPRDREGGHGHGGGGLGAACAPQRDARAAPGMPAGTGAVPRTPSQACADAVESHPAASGRVDPMAIAPVGQGQGGAVTAAADRQGHLDRSSGIPSLQPDPRAAIAVADRS